MIATTTNINNKDNSNSNNIIINNSRTKFVSNSCVDSSSVTVVKLCNR